MKAPLRLALAAPLLAALPATAADISIDISPPGVFGRVDIHGLPTPRLVLPRPVIITQPAVTSAPPVRADVARPVAPVARPQPVYMWVPPGHRRDWRHHCREYHACGVPVYFVHDDWYRQHVHPEGRGRGHDRDREHGGKGRGKGGDRD